MPKIEVQYFEGCLHVAQAVQLVERYREEFHNVELILTQVESDYEVARVGFRDSPTILVNGKDLFGDPIPDELHLACRFYPNGLPDYEQFNRMVMNL